jgi:hypothetical protein
MECLDRAEKEAPPILAGRVFVLEILASLMISSYIFYGMARSIETRHGNENFEISSLFT